MGEKYTTNFHGNVGAVAVGDQASAQTGDSGHRVTQAEYRQMLQHAQGALVNDQDALDRIDSRLYEALSQFLRLAREVQVEVKSVADAQAQMKTTLDEVWAKQMARGLRPEILPSTLEFAKSLAANPVMLEVWKSLVHRG